MKLPSLNTALAFMLGVMCVALFVQNTIRGTKIDNRNAEIERLETELSRRDARLVALASDTLTLRRTISHWVGIADSINQRALQAESERLETLSRVQYWKEIALAQQPDSLYVPSPASSIRFIDFADWYERVRPNPRR